MKQASVPRLLGNAALLLICILSGTNVAGFVPPCTTTKPPLLSSPRLVVTTTTTRPPLSCRRLKQFRLHSTTATTAVASSIASSSSSSSLAWWYMTLLAFQFGLQPILTKMYTPKTICRSTFVLAQDIVRFFAAGAFLYLSGSWSSSLTGWSVRTWWIVAGIPALLYAVQNYCALMAYQNLPPVTFNVLNQTKTLSAALCCYLVMKRPQSPLQIVSLLVLLLSALVIEKVIPLQRQVVVVNDDTTTNDNNNKSAEDRRTHLVSGVLPVLMASFLSGLAGALSQKSLQTMGRNSYLFTMELSAASIIFLVSSLTTSPDGRQIYSRGFFYGWTGKTWIPLLTNALGGIVVGLVTKYAGSVKKGFALIFGLLLSGIFQSKQKGGITSEQVVGGLLAAFSLYMYSTNPVAIVK